MTGNNVAHLMRQYLAEQPYREDVVRAAIAWVGTNLQSIRERPEGALGGITEAFPHISDREMLSVSATLRSIAAAMAPAMGTA
jgi:hypothetical protein